MKRLKITTPERGLTFRITISNEEMREYLDHQTIHNVLTSLRNAELDRLVHRNDDGNKLTQKGKLYVEKKYGPELEED